MKQRQIGFTLVEAAVVLVIIGLLAGAVLSTQNILRGARVNSVVSMVFDLRSAVAGFQDRYGYMPGDCPTTVSDCNLPLQTPAGPLFGPGSGDGLTCCLNPDGSPVPGWESFFAIAHLYTTGFLAQVDVGNPNALLSTPWGGVQITTSGQNLVPLYLGPANVPVRHVIVFQNLPCEIAEAVDAKLDDGNVYTGRAMGNQATGAPAGTCPEGAIINLYQVAL